MQEVTVALFVLNKEEFRIDSIRFWFRQKYIASDYLNTHRVLVRFFFKM